VNLPGTKGLTLSGTGATISGRINLNTNSSTGTRITGFTFTRGGINGDGAILVYGNDGDAAYRIDNNTFAVTPDDNGLTFIEADGNGTGMIDHNTFRCPANCEMIHNMGMGATDASGWSVVVTPGGPSAMYVEDNQFYNNEVPGNPDYFWGSSGIQSYYGARTVFRHNYLFMSHVDQHGTPGMIGARWWEVYENTFDTNTPNASQSDYIDFRGGSGVCFNNHQTGDNLGAGSISLFEEDPGYPALYQVGRGQNQVLDPAYVWGNDASMTVGSASDNVQVNRDFYLTPKPGYVPYTYPYPTDATGLPSVR
jgi:hypothetical protein